MFNKKIIILFCLIFNFYFSIKCGQACVTLMVGDGKGVPGSSGNPVEVTLDNQNYRVKGIQVDVCDVDNYLVCTACVVTGRTSGFQCTSREGEDGCCAVVLFSNSGALIEKGTGSVLALKYDISAGAPTGNCRALNPQDVVVADEMGSPLAATVVSGIFCFLGCGDVYPDESYPGANDCGDGVTDILDVVEGINMVLGIGAHSACQLRKADLPTGTPPDCINPDGIVDIFDILVIIDVVLQKENCCDYTGTIKCTTDEDCPDDGLYCNGVERCVGGVCKPGTNPCPDDGLYCNGVEGCDEGNDQCVSSGNPCAPNICDEANDTCREIECQTAAECNDDNPCTTDSCVEGFCVNEPTTGPCDDGLYCTVNDTCINRACVGVARNCDDGLYCTGSESCVEATDQCVHSGNPCPDDGLYCNGVESCNEAQQGCIPPNNPCSDQEACTDDICIEILDLCVNTCNATSYSDPCCQEPVCSDTAICKAIATITIGEQFANCGDVGVKVPICLDNTGIGVGGVQVDLCESVDDCLECAGCELTARTTIFDCIVQELANGCCRVIVYSKHPGGVINRGICTIVIIDYTLKNELQCCEECITVNPENILVADQYGYEVYAVGSAGKVCPVVCGDVAPADNPVTPLFDCGDGKINIFDVLEEVAFALGTNLPDSCQEVRADVPTGTPPYCNGPDGMINVLDIMVVVDMALGKQDCCSYYYGGRVY